MTGEGQQDVNAMVVGSATGQQAADPIVVGSATDPGNDDGSPTDSQLETMIGYEQPVDQDRGGNEYQGAPAEEMPGGHMPEEQMRNVQRGSPGKQSTAFYPNNPYDISASISSAEQEEAFDEFLDLLPTADELGEVRAQELGFGSNDRINEAYDHDIANWRDAGNNRIASDRESRALIYGQLGDKSKERLRAEMPRSWTSVTVPADNPYFLPVDLARDGDQFVTLGHQFMRSKPKPVDVARFGKAKMGAPPSPNPDPPMRSGPVNPNKASGSGSSAKPGPSTSKAGPTTRSGGKRTSPQASSKQQNTKTQRSKTRKATSPPPNPAKKTKTGHSHRSPSPVGDNDMTPQVPHPPYQGIPGQAISTKGIKISQFIWESWPLYNQWTDYKNGAKPPACVRLDDWNLWHVCILPHAERKGLWPADLDNDGNIRRARANYGYPAKEMDEDGVWRYMVFKTVYQLCGNEKDGSIPTLKGTIEDLKGQGRPYFSLGDEAKVQAHTGPMKTAYPATGQPTQKPAKQGTKPPSTTPNPTPPTATPKPTPGPSRAAPSTEGTMTPVPTSYLEMRKRGIVNSDDEEEMIPDMPQPDNTVNLVRQILLIDEELGSRLQAEGKVKKEAIAATRRALHLQEASYEFHKETVRVTAEKLTEDLPKMLKEGLSPAKAQAVEEERLGFQPTKRWKGMKIEPQD